MKNDSTKQRAISILSEEIIKNRLVIFVGAGCSVAAGLPAWKEMIDKLLNEYSIETKDTDLLRLASRIERKVGKLKLRESIAESLRTSPDTTSPLFDKLTRLDVNLFITTNYDHLLEDTFRKNGYSPVAITDDKDLPAVDRDKKTIVKLHGDINSVSSIVVTKSDYTKYKSNHKGFIEWLNAIVAHNTVIFIGTSFDDPRLNDMDDHVVELFENCRRQPFLLLKRPQKDESQSQKDFDIDMEDFEAHCEDFKDRDFFVVPIDQYDEIPDFFEKVQTKTRKKKYKQGSTNFGINNFLQTDHVTVLENNLKKLLDEKTLQLSELVSGKGRRPTFTVMKERADSLIAHLENPSIGGLSPEARLEGYLTLADAFLNSNKHEDLENARRYYELSNSAYIESRHKVDWENRILRVRAKLLFFENKIDEAIKSITHSKNPKTVSLWLAFLIDTGRLEKAYDYISKQSEQNPAWICMALSVLIELGHIQEAEDKYTKILKEYFILQKNGKLKNSEFKGEYFYEQLHFQMANAFYYRAVKLSGKPEFSTIYPGQLNRESEHFCNKALFYIEKQFKQTSRQNLKENYLAYRAIDLEMRAAHLLGLIDRSDKAANDLLSVRPVMRDVSQYILNRGAFFDKAIVNNVTSYLIQDHPDSYWAFEIIALLEALYLKNSKASWEALEKAKILASSREEKEQVAMTALDLGIELGLYDESLAIVYELIEKDNFLRQFLDARYQYFAGDAEKAEQTLIELEKENFNHASSLQIKAQINALLGISSIKKENWENARKFLEKSIKTVPDPSMMKDLLNVHGKFQNDAEALKIVEQIEKTGEDDEQVIHIKAQAARNLGKFQLSEETWYRLFKKFDQKSEYAYGLAEMLFLNNKPQDSLKTLDQFIQCNDKTDPACLALACNIHESEDDALKAFRLLQRCYANIQNNPQLLVKHMELGYRTGNEKKSNESMKRLQNLDKEGRVPEGLFRSMDLNQMIEFFQHRHETIEKLDKQYKLGRYPRLMLCEDQNIPLYLDWAVRTQELSLPNDPKAWGRYITYATNGMRIQRVEKRNQLTTITAPPDAMEIVIDYHALITMHRLGLLEKIEQRYKKIYYPYILEIIWKNDQHRFGHHQLSKEEAYRTLDEKLKSNRIKEMTAPAPLETKKKKKNDVSKRDLRLARLGKLVLIDAFVEKKDLIDFTGITVVRLTQVLSWLYSEGKITENEFRELKAIYHGKSEIIKKGSHKILKDATQFLVSRTTLELMEQYNLNKHLFALGKSIVVEKNTAYYFHQAVLEIDFGKKVGEWHRELSKSVMNSKVFKSVHPEIDYEDKEFTNSPAYIALSSSIKYSEKNNFPLLTDDRTTQMMSKNEWVNQQFGTDVLLLDLFEKKIITIQEYANNFLQLCQWRYRFLIPDVRVLLFFAKQYKKRPLGQPLKDIANYGRQCMNDPGLFLGPELTDPPLPLGLKLMMTWVKTWLEFLIYIWQDNEFKSDTLKQITGKIYKQALPDPPKDLKDEMRENYSGFLETKLIIGHLFSFISGVKPPEKLHGLLNQTFREFGYDENKKIDELKEYLERIYESLDSDIDIQAGRVIVSQILIAFYGKKENYSIPAQLHLILQKFGLLKNEQDTIQTLKSDEEDRERIGSLKFDEIADQILAHQKLPEYEPDTPFIQVHPASEKPGFIFVPYELIQAPSAKLRITALNNILKHGKVSKPTKTFVEKKAENIKSNNPALWRPAAEEASHVILKDFSYASSLFAKAMPLTPPRQDWVGAAWKNVLQTDLDSVLSEIPGIISKGWSDKILQQKLRGEVSFGIKEENDYTTIMSNTLDWYMNEIGFVPFEHPFDFWNIIGESLFSKVYESNSERVWHEVEKWIESKQDPLAYLVALQVVLNARRLAPDNQKNLFSSKKFIAFLNGILTVLINPETKTGEATKNLELRWILAIWKIRVLLAQHYLRYIDLNLQDSMDDEKKILIAWWMAREVSSSLIDSMTHLKQEDQIFSMETDAAENIKKIAETYRIEYLFFKTNKPHSSARFCTLYSAVSNMLPTNATMATLSGQHDQDHGVCNCFQGIIKPSKALAPEMRNVIIEKLGMQMITGTGQLDLIKTGKPRLLWDIPLSISAPFFLQEYYNDNIKYLGKEKMAVLDMAKDVSSPDFLDKELTNLPKRIKDGKGGDISFTILNSLYVFLSTHGKMPNSAKIFKEYPMVVNDISKLDDPSNWYCLLILIKIFSQLQSWNDFKWTEIISELFKRIDYSEMSESSTDRVVEGIISMVLQGADYTLFKPMLDISIYNKKVRNSLGQLKLVLSNIFSKLPGSYREIVRKLLFDLEDIPVPDKLTDAAGVKDEK